MVILAVLTKKKKNLEGFSYQTSGNINNESSHEELSVGGQGATCEIQSLAKDR